MVGAVVGVLARVAVAAGGAVWVAAGRLTAPEVALGMEVSKLLT